MTGNMAAERQTVARYKAFFESVTQETVEEVLPLIADDIRFVDPFNDLTGRAAFIRVFVKMFEDVEGPSFAMLEEAWGDGVCFLKWRMSCRQRHLGDWTVDGVTELRFDDGGRVNLHRDYWDAGAALYGRLPLLRHAIAFVRRKLAVT